QRLEGRLPPNRLDIDIALDGDARRAAITAHGSFEGRPLEF
ncbi:MAG: tRNA (adenosine(37)-N6)-threonylcarbamoyltransferase complex ATPase subunit type 1 TsaE, partial [Caulobacter sp.]|nr:tRNA (adenosine(37)-N6)-threonylcarbamoyltransferase complex ATPase subunit type 1 TsaE [Caulobacter sp.]